MKILKATITALSATTISLLGLTGYLYFEVESIKEKNLTITESDIVAIVDARLEVIEKRKALEALARLEKGYDLAQESTPDNRMLYGDHNAIFTLQEFADIECPYCRKMHGGIKQVIDHSQGVINWEFKHFPLPSHNPAAANESLIVGCIAENYGNKKAWIALEKLITETRGAGKGIENDEESFARSLGLNGRIIQNCIAADDVKHKINNDFDDGRKLNIKSTPAIRVINNKTKEEYLIKGYKTPEQILELLKTIMEK